MCAVAPSRLLATFQGTLAPGFIFELPLILYWNEIQEALLEVTSV